MSPETLLGGTENFCVAHKSWLATPRDSVSPKNPHGRRGGSLCRPLGLAVVSKELCVARNFSVPPKKSSASPKKVLGHIEPVIFDPGDNIRCAGALFLGP